MSLQQVHLRVNDADTGKPTPVRLRITDANGAYYAPYGRLTEFATGVNQDVGGNVQIGNKKWCYIDGACEILLPPGTLHIEISKGPEYTPIDEQITLVAGKMSLRFTIERWIDMRKLGWYSGDTRVHFMSPDAALLEGQAEDVAVVNLLAKDAFVKEDYGKAPTVSNILSFSGQSFARISENCGVSVNTHHRYVRFGSLGLLNCHRVVYPLTNEGSNWSFADWCGQCHRKNGLVVWTEAVRATTPHMWRGPLADLVLGEIDAIEFLVNESSPVEVLADFYPMFNAGVRAPLVGASGKASNKGVLGGIRTYAHIGEGNALTYAAWIEAVRAGRTYVSNGPLLDYTINGKVSSVAGAEPFASPVHLHARAISLTPFDQLEILCNGETIASAAPGASQPLEAVLDLELPADTTGWLAVMCRSNDVRNGPWSAFAHSSPFRIDSEVINMSVKQEAVEGLIAELDQMTTYSHGHGYDELLRVMEAARTALAKKLS
jgi:hypothetical protein